MAKTLDIKSLVGTMSTSELEKKLENSIMGKYAGVFKKHYVNNLSGIPTLQAYMQMCPGLEEELYDLYNSVNALEKDKDLIDEDIRVYQGALFDGLCFIYDAEKNAVIGLFTTNFSILNHLNVEKDMAALAFKKNKEGEVKGLRVDVSYEQKTSNFSYSTVNARVVLDCAKQDEDPTKRYYMVPYVAISEYMKFIEMLLNTGKTIYVSQDIGESGTKERLISYNKNILSKYCDNPDALSTVEPKMFPLSCFFYAPVVGAPSISSMVTRVNPILVKNVRGAENGDIKKLGIRKSENPLKEMISNSMVINALMYVKEDDISHFATMLRRFPRCELLGDDLAEVSDGMLASYLHSLTPSELEDVYLLVPVLKKVDSIVKEIGTGRLATQEEIANLREIVNDKVIKVTIQKSDCTIGSVFGTNNTEILSSIYGKRYFKKYESFAFRYGVFCKNCRGPKSIKKGLQRADFKRDDETIKYLEHLMEMHKGDMDAFYDAAKGYIAEGEGISIKRSESSSNSKAKSNLNMVMVRGMDAYLSPDGKPVNFIKNINIENVIGCIIFEK